MSNSSIVQFVFCCKLAFQFGNLTIQATFPESDIKLLFVNGKKNDKEMLHALVVLGTDKLPKAHFGVIRAHLKEMMSLFRPNDYTR